MADAPQPSRESSTGGRHPDSDDKPKRRYRITLPTLSGLGALLAVGVSVWTLHVTSQQTNQKQITDRYDAAITELASKSIDVRLGSIYALQRLMIDSPPDQPTIVSVLCAFVRDQSAKDSKGQSSPARPVPTDIQAALTVVGTRNTEHDGPTTGSQPALIPIHHTENNRSATRIDLNHALLAGAQLGNLHLAGANFAGADLVHAHLNGTDLARANLTEARLTGASLDGTNLGGANLASARLQNSHLTNTVLKDTNLSHVNLSHAVLIDATLTGAVFSGAKLTDAVFSGGNFHGLSFATTTLTGADISGLKLPNAYLVAAELKKAKLVNTDLSGADLTDADLTSADIRHANLKGENLSYANLAGADLYAATLTSASLTGANLTGADLRAAKLTSKNPAGVYVMDVNLTGANLKCAHWPQRGVKVPAGWQRIPRSDRLKRPRALTTLKSCRLTFMRL